jgi:Abnormal spindle-like microcephaly-assoc'd, ASPM-SPD-2-Hydin/Beta-propeller repeat
MGPRGYPACVLFFFVVAVSFLGMGRVALRELRPAGSGAPFISNSRQRASGTGLGAEIPVLAGLTAGLQPRPPGETAQNSPTDRPSQILPPSGPSLPAADPAPIARAANFSLPISFEPAGGRAEAPVQYVGRGRGMTVMLESSGIEIAVGGGVGSTANPGSVKLRLMNGGTAHEGVTGFGVTDDDPTQPPSHRKNHRGPASKRNTKPRTRQPRNRRSVPRRDTPGHSGQKPRGQRAPTQRIPRQTKPSGQLEIPPPRQTNSDAKFAWQGASPLGGESNYFLGSDPAKWRTHVQHFAAAEAKNVLPGVAIVAYGNAEGMEYDLRVAPGVDARDLRLEITNEGVARTAKIRIDDASGDLFITLEGREMRMKKPAIYEEWAATDQHSSRRKRVEGGYELAPDGSVGFQVAPYDPRATLVLDPSLTVTYATFLGGAGNDAAQGIALDSTGNVYIGGTTTSAATFPEGGPRLGPTGSSDFFIAKINPAMSGAASLVYLTFIGGSGAEFGGKIAVDGSGNAAIAGTSTSVDYPVTDGSALTVGTNGTAVNDAAITEIDPTGAKLVYSTLFGGNGNEATLSSGGIAMDSAGDIYLAMDTQSTNLTVAPAATSTTPGPFSSSYGGGGSDGFLAVFRRVVAGATPHLDYCTYLGIFAESVTLSGVAVDSVGNAYLAGYTSNPTGTLLTTNGFQTTYQGDPYDAFVMKILPSGNGVADLSYGTFLGGSGMDQALAITVGTALPGTAYVTGTTQSINFPVTGRVFGNIAPYQASLNGKANAFLAVIGQNGAGLTSLLYSSYLGGETADVGLGVWFAETNRVYVAGSTTSANFPAQFNFQPFSGDQDAFVSELDPTSAGAASLLFSTPLGGTSAADVSATALAAGVAANASGNVYVTGATTSGDFPLAGNPNTGLQVTCVSCQQTPPLNDAFLVEITASTAAMPSVSLNTGKLNFGIQPVGTLTIPPQAVSVKNTGDLPLNISSITLAGVNSADFSMQNPIACTSAAIPPAGMCSFEVGFVPSLVGPEGAFVNFADDAPTGSQVLEVVGVGGGPLAVVSPLSVNFGDQPEGTISSTSQTVTLTNAGNQPLTVSGVILPSGATAGEFPPMTPFTACALVVLAPGTSCSISINFQPATTGLISGEVGFVDNSGFLTGSEQVVTVSGTGTGMAPVLTVSPASLSFGTQPVGITSGTQTVTLTNAGSALLNLTGIAITGNASTNFGFFVKGTNPCPLPSGILIAGVSCTISVDFAPQAAGSVSATLSISDNATGSPQTVALNGTGGTSGISLSPPTLNFASQTVGASSPAQIVTVSNTGTTPVAMTISVVGTNPGDFAETDNCSQSPLAGGKSCVMNVTFDPAQTGARSAVLMLSDNAPQSPQILAVSGTAVQATAAISPTGTIGFGGALAGTDSPPVTVTITNNGTGAAILSVGSATVNPPGNFTAVNNCTAGVPAAGSCTLAVTFTPAASPAAAPCGSNAGTHLANLLITDNAPTSPQSIALSGTASDYCLAPAGVASQTVTAGTPATFQLLADSSGTFAGSVALTCADAALSSTCTVQPATVNLTSGAQTPIVLSVATAANAAAAFDTAPEVLPFGTKATSLGAWRLNAILPWSLLLCALVLARAAAVKRQLPSGTRFAQTGAVAILLSISLAACFGGGTSTATPVGTPTGTYTMIVTGTFTGTGGSTTRSVQVTLIVQ